jgi:8-oxo-dGTP pyrophosphatase MutT (NUDIX family)
MRLKQTFALWLRRIPPLRWLLALAVRGLVPRHYVGASGVIFNQAGQVLVLEHVFRLYYPWGLPGGWVERGEDPADTVRREVFEELGVSVEVKQLLACQLQGGGLGDTTPAGLGLVYYCRWPGEPPDWPSLAQKSSEILAIEWLDPAAIRYSLSPLDRQGIALARQEFEKEIGD